MINSMEVINHAQSCDLETALEFENDHLIIDGFMKRYNVDLEEAASILQETKKWLWIAAKASDEEKFSLSIEKPLAVIDEMWHNFILHTRQYHKYCMDKFKRFIHHDPTPSSEKVKFQQRVAENPTEEVKKWKDRYQQQLSYIYDHLGPETVIKWYEELPSKYTPNYLESLKKKA